jgi:hypothetical protein
MPAKNFSSPGSRTVTLDGTPALKAPFPIVLHTPNSHCVPGDNPIKPARPIGFRFSPVGSPSVSPFGHFPPILRPPPPLPGPRGPTPPPPPGIGGGQPRRGKSEHGGSQKL